MAVLAECPICHTKRSTRNKLCKCGQDLAKLNRRLTKTLTKGRF